MNIVYLHHMILPALHRLQTKVYDKVSLKPHHIFGIHRVRHEDSDRAGGLFQYSYRSTVQRNFFLIRVSNKTKFATKIDEFGLHTEPDSYMTQSHSSIYLQSLQNEQPQQAWWPIRAYLVQPHYYGHIQVNVHSIWTWSA